MNVILFTKRMGSRHVDLRHPAVMVLILAMIGAVLGTSFVAGITYAERFARTDPDTRVAQLEQELLAQSAAVVEARQEAADQLEALSVRLGQMQAHVIRLDALGARLTRMAGLDQGEFDFGSAPPQGGPEGAPADTPSGPEFMEMLESLELRLADRQRQLGVLENLILNRNLQREVTPTGRPVDSGWLSSYYGYRSDPFTGKRTWHDGIDFAGKAGTEVVAVASGVVTWSGPRYGYGNLVEIKHGNGYSTRYAHNAETRVEVGETVKKGQVIALMGDTGRATAPHSHFEVLKGGRSVDPLQFIKRSD